MNAPTLLNLSAQQLRQAAELKDRIERLQGELNRLVGGTAAPSVPVARTGRRKMSAAAIERIRAAQRARWAKIKRGQPKKAAAPKRRISAAGRAKLAALARARWQKARAQGRSTL